MPTTTPPPEQSAPPPAPPVLDELVAVLADAVRDDSEHYEDPPMATS